MRGGAPRNGDALDLEEQLVEERARRWMEREGCGKRQEKTMKDGEAGVMRRCWSWSTWWKQLNINE